jgi:hypothetical protein
MARRDLSNTEIEEMGLDDPGSAAAYLEARREELEAEKQTAREKDDEQRFVEQFVAAGGHRADALAARKTLQNEQAFAAARRADEDALEQVRLHVARSL